MGAVLGLGMTHYPGLHMLDDDMAVFLRRTLAGKRLAPELKDPANWPAAMREEWSTDEGAAAGREHRRRCLDATRVLRERLDRFAPDVVVVFGDDQYENFVEDIVPPFCVFALDGIESRPFDIDPASGMPTRNIWGEGPGTVFRHRGAPDAARWLLGRLIEEGVPLPYAYRARYDKGLAHAFINTLLFLDVDRKGFPYPVLPFHVNCYGGDFIRSRGGMVAPSDVEQAPDPTAPTPRSCFDVGHAVGKAFAASKWRVALVASSSWSHAFLTPKNGWLYPDHQSDRDRFAELRDGKLARWRDLPLGRMTDAGQHEMLNWVTLAGAMVALGKQAEVVDWVESYVMNSNKCFAVWA